MKFYLAASIKEKKKAAEICNKIKLAGHQIAADWTQDIPITRDDKNFFTEKQKRALRDLDGVLNCDIFVILSEPIDGRAKYSELGAALASHLNSNKPKKIYVVGSDTTRSLFFFHPAVEHKKSIEAVLDSI